MKDETLRSSVKKDRKESYIHEIGRKETDRGTLKFHQIVIEDYTIYVSYCVFFLSNCISSMSISSIPAIIEEIKKDFNITNASEIGYISSLYYTGETLGKNFIYLGLMFYYLIINYNFRKTLMMTSLFINFLSLLGVFLVTNYTLLIFLRMTSGFATIYFAIFTPVWIDQYIKYSKSSIIMSFHHLESILGTITGFLLTALIAEHYSWKISFLVQSVLAFFLLIFTFFINSFLFSRTIQRVGESDNFILLENVINDEKHLKNPINQDSTNFEMNEIEKDEYNDVRDEGITKTEIGLKKFSLSLINENEDEINEGTHLKSFTQILYLICKNPVSF